ncbi:hypothetical protein GMLC_15710 [Geomonas limicola]|uniref:FecR protein domain-containing protein n=1 Tax=Geomonas limicola TaxID=2740186 RepID=A0A6V8N5Z8_9BACT|nr:FecR family protein [Geomonas limicola]GFO67992.1 hypothetical protein GMLC_15710 [Geomonas limicola]
MVAKKIRIVVLSALLLFWGVPLTLAGQPSVGKVVAIKGAASIGRAGGQVPAKVKGELFASDTVKTAAGSRAKLLFIDDSVLTLSENSTLVVQEFIDGQGKQGRSIYNLLDGKLRSVVGKTKFEVRTPTAVAAARGTVIFFDVGKVKNESYSRIICLEGKVEVNNVVSSVRGTTLLTPGTMVVVKAGQVPPPAVPAPPAELEKARRATSSSAASGESSGSGSASSSSSDGGSAKSASAETQENTGNTGSTGTPALPAVSGTSSAGTGFAPPVQTLPIKQPTRVNITIGIPH